MTVNEAADELSNLAYRFRNDMLRDGVQEMAPERWLEAFRSWLPSEEEFEREWLRQFECRDAAGGAQPTEAEGDD